MPLYLLHCFTILLYTSFLCWIIAFKLHIYSQPPNSILQCSHFLKYEIITMQSYFQLSKFISSVKCHVIPCSDKNPGCIKAQLHIYSLYQWQLIVTMLILSNTCIILGKHKRGCDVFGGLYRLRSFISSVKCHVIPCSDKNPGCIKALLLGKNSSYISCCSV
jgi:hypothetical protein